MLPDTVQANLLGKWRPGSAYMLVGSPNHLKVASLLSSVCPVPRMKSLEKLWVPKGTSGGAGTMPEELKMKALRKPKVCPAEVLSSRPTVTMRYMFKLCLCKWPHVEGCLWPRFQRSRRYFCCVEQDALPSSFSLHSIPPMLLTLVLLFGVGLCCLPPQDVMGVFNKQQKTCLLQICCFAMLFLIV